MALPLDGQTLFGVGMLLVSTFVSLVSLRYVWRLAGVLRSPAVAALDGTPTGTRVRIEGTTVVDEESVDGPFTGRTGTVCEASAEERRLSPFGLPWNVTLWERQEGVDFTLRTQEAAIPVANPRRTVLLAPDDVLRVGFRELPPERIADLEERTPGLPASTAWRDPPTVLAPVWRLLSFGTRTYTEAVLQAGDEVTVVGRVRADGGVVPLVVSDRSTRRTLLGMGRTALGGLAVGLGGLCFGLLLVAI